MPCAPWCSPCGWGADGPANRRHEQRIEPRNPAFRLIGCLLMARVSTTGWMSFDMAFRQSLYWCLECRPCGLSFRSPGKGGVAVAPQSKPHSRAGLAENHPDKEKGEHQ